MKYDCKKYPGVCQDTACWQDWYPSSPGLLQFEYNDVINNQRTYSMSAISDVSAGPGLHRDECPVNKVSGSSLIEIG
jgi:hypothetical protein